MEEIKETVLEVLYAVLPVIVVIFLMQITIMWLPMYYIVQLIVGGLFVILGLILFLIGIQIGLLPVGESIGNVIPKFGKISVIVFFGFLLGFVVTVAEPDVRVLASQIDIVSEGAISNMVLIYTVAVGVGIFVAISMLREVLNIPLHYILIFGYITIFVLSIFTPAHFVPISFDAGGVTTGPLTAPFVLAFGVGVTSVLGKKEKSNDGFGLVALASIGPILAVMILGVIYG